MKTSSFFDTNVLIYAFGQAGQKTALARELLEQGGGWSVQVMNEFVNASRRKLNLDYQEITVALAIARRLLDDPVPLTEAVHVRAMEFCVRDGVHIYDANIVSAAFHGLYPVVISEDLQDGREFLGRVRILNPFKAAQTSNSSPTSL